MKARSFFVSLVAVSFVLVSWTARAQSGPDDGPINTARKSFTANLAVVNALLGEAREEMVRRNGKPSAKKAAQAAIDAAVDLVGDATDALIEAEKISDPAGKAAAIQAAVALLDDGTANVAAPTDARDQAEVALAALRSLRRGGPSAPPPPSAPAQDTRCKDASFAAAHPSICPNA